MELTVLGSDGMYAAPGGTTSGYLVRRDGFSLWIDLGSGTLASLQTHIGFDEVDAAIVSHRHPDHLEDLFTFYIARIYGPPEPLPPIPLYAPPEVLDRARRFLDEEGSESLERTFRVEPVEPGTGFEVGPFRVATAPMAHPAQTIGLRLEADGAVLAYSADTGPCRALVDLAEGADVLLAEASWQSDGEDYPPDLHLRASDAGEHARAAGAGRLLLTHIKPGLDHERSRREAAEVFDGDVDLAERGMVVKVRG